MAHNQSDLAENAAARERLEIFVRKLSDADLCHPLAAGWTVSAVMAHLAFWDKRALVLIEKWKQDGIGPSPMDVDIINEATRELCLAIPPRAAVEIAIASATAIDRAIEQLNPEMAADIEANGKTVRLNRALHRHDHLNQIAKALERNWSEQ
jgi:hypothetical protein